MSKSKRKSKRAKQKIPTRTRQTRHTVQPKQATAPAWATSRWWWLLPIAALLLILFAQISSCRSSRSAATGNGDGESLSETSTVDPVANQSVLESDDLLVDPAISSISPAAVDKEIALVRYDRAQGAQGQFVSMMKMEDQPRLVQWFGEVPADVQQGRVDDLGKSNIRPEDYAGSSNCQSCHAENYKHWSDNPHSKMNAWATDENVRGDFSGDAPIHYMGGVGDFYKEGDEYRMRMTRDQVERVYRITRTIGSRFFQYYVGQLVDGPEAADHVARSEDHLLPFGYWFENKQWVPVVNIDGESPDAERVDPFAAVGEYHYDNSCSECHTTKPTGDTLLGSGMMRRMDSYSPRIVHFASEDYMRETHPELVSHLGGKPVLSKAEMETSLNDSMRLPVKEHGVELGVACEACHNGCKDHVENEKQLPDFFPVSRHISTLGPGHQGTFGRSDTNANFVCARCHAGNRVRYASGSSTWNSTEFSDGARGGCYDMRYAYDDTKRMLTCVHCHDPHKPIGQIWQRTAAEDNASCIACHEQFNDATTRLAHTHHAAGSAGDDCMNCHMPRINEGLQDVVRTHTIFSPTNKAMVEANQPNACNCCHVEESIDWTLKYLKDWYNADDYSSAEIAKNYPDRSGAVAVGWLKSEHHGTRLIGSDSLTRAKADWAMSDIINMLDDDYLINRQFTARGLKSMLGRDVRDLGYEFYMFSAERAEPIEEIRKAFSGVGQ